MYSKPFIKYIVRNLYNEIHTFFQGKFWRRERTFYLRKRGKKKKGKKKKKWKSIFQITKQFPKRTTTFYGKRCTITQDHNLKQIQASIQPNDIEPFSVLSWYAEHVAARSRCSRSFERNESDTVTAPVCTCTTCAYHDTSSTTLI